jgi:large subunit ribosomal protein L18
MRGTPERPRLNVNRTLKHIYCQVIDDTRGVTLAAASSTEKDLRDQIKVGGNKEAAARVGALLAERAKAAGISAVSLDRGSFRYGGRLAALANAVREGGISF